MEVTLELALITGALITVLLCSDSPHNLPGLPELTISMTEYYEAGAGQDQRLDDTRLDRFAAAKLDNTDWHR